MSAIGVRDLASESVSLGEYAFSTGPFYLSGLVLFVLGTGIYREEDLFTQRAVPLKFLDALGARLRRYRSVALLSTLFIPFVFIAELLGIAVLFALPIGYSLPVLFLVIATVEELGKSVHIYAGYAQNRFETGWRTALLLGALSGVGFFLGEKLTLLAQAVGLPELALGRAAFVPSGAGGIELLALALAPLALHCVTASISAFGAHRSKRGYLIGLLGAIGVHAAYNLTVVSALV
jgi:RsiW-degrading membrane proteinase PrsW (M82 family)